MSLGAKTKQIRAEKTCRTPPPEFEMEPYGSSYGPKPFWAFWPSKPCSTRGQRGGRMGHSGHKGYIWKLCFFLQHRRQSNSTPTSGSYTSICRKWRYRELSRDVGAGTNILAAGPKMESNSGSSPTFGTRGSKNEPKSEPPRPNMDC